MFVNTLISGPTKKLINNIFSIGLLQGANYILPFIVAPYLIKIIGLESYGLIAFVSAIMTYFALIADYGFNLTATQEVSVNQSDNEKLVEIFSSVLIIKLALMLLLFLILSVAIMLFDNLKELYLIYFISFGSVVGQVISPLWFFQGMQKMSIVTYINLICKTTFTVLIFFFVHDKSDYLLVPLFLSLGFLSSGILTLYFVKVKFKIYFSMQKNAVLKGYIINGWKVFLSSIFTSIYTVSTTLILGFFTNNTNVGIYSAAEKIIQALKAFYAPFSIAFFPYLSRMLISDVRSGLIQVKKMIFFISPLMFLFCLIVFCNADFFLQALYKTNDYYIVNVLKILSFIPFLVTLSNIYGIQVLVNLGKQKEFLNILILSGVLGCVLHLFLVKPLGVFGTAYSLLFTEFLVTVLMFIKYYQVSRSIKLIS